jgi:hypothetical protein
MESFDHQVVEHAWRTKKSAGLSPGATFGPMKNLDVFNRGPKFLSVPLSSQLTAKEMPLIKQLIY